MDDGSRSFDRPPPATGVYFGVLSDATTQGASLYGNSLGIPAAGFAARR